jgi:peptide/nickel transport system permease protein
VTAQLPLPGAPLQHYVSSAPFDPLSIEAMTDAQAKVHLAS